MNRNANRLFSTSKGPTSLSRGGGGGGVGGGSGRIFKKNLQSPKRA